MPCKTKCFQLKFGGLHLTYIWYILALAAAYHGWDKMWSACRSCRNSPRCLSWSPSFPRLAESSVRSPPCSRRGIQASVSVVFSSFQVFYVYVIAGFNARSSPAPHTAATVQNIYLGASGTVIIYSQASYVQEDEDNASNKYVLERTHIHSDGKFKHFL